MSSIVEKAISETIGTKLTHLATGRPFIVKDFDVSISHKDGINEAKIVFYPQRIGIDVENLAPNINVILFLRAMMTREEVVFLKKFLFKNKLSLESGVAIFWSIKEAFFKCLDYDLKPAKVNIINILKNGEVRLTYAEEIEKIMEEKKIKIHRAKFEIKNDYVYSEVIMNSI